MFWCDIETGCQQAARTSGSMRAQSVVIRLWQLTVFTHDIDCGGQVGGGIGQGAVEVKQYGLWSLHKTRSKIYLHGWMKVFCYSNSQVSNKQNDLQWALAGDHVIDAGVGIQCIDLGEGVITQALHCQ